MMMEEEEKKRRRKIQCNQIPIKPLNFPNITKY